MFYIVSRPGDCALVNSWTKNSLQVCAAAIFVAVSATGGGGYGQLEEAGYGGHVGYGGGVGLGAYEGNEIGHDVGGGHHEEFVDYYVSNGGSIAWWLEIDEWINFDG